MLSTCPMSKFRQSPPDLSLRSALLPGAHHLVNLLGEIGILLEQAMDFVTDLQQRLGIHVGLLELAIGLGRDNFLTDHDN